MTMCRGHSTQHDGINPQPYVTGHAERRHRVQLCRGCFAALVAIGMDWRPA